LNLRSEWAIGGIVTCGFGDNIFEFRDVHAKVFFADGGIKSFRRPAVWQVGNQPFALGPGFVRVIDDDLMMNE
jgi:hypothetical protein